jgi:hypothetical protein
MMDNLDELTKEQAVGVLRQVAQIDGRLFDLAIARFNFDDLSAVARAKDEIIGQLSEELEDLKNSITQEPS